jgi:DNA-binding CsgD family transcriptional regulator
MNFLTLSATIVKNIFFMQALTRKLGEPVQLTEEECNTVFEDLKADTMMAQKFALTCNIKTMSIDFQHNTERFLSHQGQLDLKKFFLLLHPDFMEDYIKWGQATYSYALNNKSLNIEPLNHCTRMTIPLKLANGKYHWVLQEAVALQIDEAGNLVSHLNVYTILNEMEGDEKVRIVGRLYNNGFEVKEWTQTVWKDFFTRQSFELTPEQQRIVETLHNNINLSNTEIADILNKTKNTIDAHNKHILERARHSFTFQAFGNVRDVVIFLKSINYFDNNL